MRKGKKTFTNKRKLKNRNKTKKTYKNKTKKNKKCVYTDESKRLMKLMKELKKHKK